MDDTYGAYGAQRVWLGIDPGVTTGWALVAHDTGKVLGSGNFSEDDIFAGLDTLVRSMHRGGYVLSVVVERMPATGGMGSLADRLDYVKRAVRMVVAETYDLPVTTIPPGEWKPSRVARTTKFTKTPKRGRTPHERDAIRMALYAIDKENRHAD
jgi:predicted RNase H-like nuclease (RuvC/YqgF family)